MTRTLVKRGRRSESVVSFWGFRYHPVMEPSATLERPRAADRVRIVSTPGTCGGRPRIDGHRITVEDIAVWRERLGMSPDEIVSAYPTLTLSDVHAALGYYYENRGQIDTDI